MISGIGYYKDISNDSEEYFGFWEGGKYNGFGYLKERDEQNKEWHYIGQF
jgi:hypothetical protein